MRGRLVLFALLAAVAGGGGWWFHQNFEVRSTEQGWSVIRRTVSSSAGGAAPAVRTGPTIRIASFNIQVFGQSKLEKPDVVDKLAEIVRRFDIVAVQEIRSESQDVLPRFVEAVNATGRHYDYVIGPRLGRTSSKEQFAFLFDRQVVELDRNQLYTLDDPQNQIHRPPFVGWFRARGPSTREAFTFSLVNVHTDPHEAPRELTVLDQVLRIVRADGRDEDDVILVGDFNADDRQILERMTVSGVFCAIRGQSTNVRMNKQLDNIVFQTMATDEFTGRIGVFDFLRQYDLTLEAAEEISDHFPVWAEFSVYEGGQPGRIAERSDEVGDLH